MVNTTICKSPAATLVSYSMSWAGIFMLTKPSSLFLPIDITTSIGLVPPLLTQSRDFSPRVVGPTCYAVRRWVSFPNVLDCNNRLTLPPFYCTEDPPSYLRTLRPFTTRCSAPINSDISERITVQPSATNIKSHDPDCRICYNA